MARRPKSDPDVHYVIGGIPIVVGTSTVQTINVKGFVTALVARGVSHVVAALYARTAARSIRAGRAYTPDAITTMQERTAVRAYWRWVGDTYHARLTPLRVALRLDNAQLGRLRCHSLVPPTPDKRVPKVTVPPQVYLNSETREARATPAQYDWVSCPSWTLHIPPAHDAPVHKDPCVECWVWELSPEQVEAIAKAFEDAWGHRDLACMPPDALLFGSKPLDFAVPSRRAGRAGRIVALAAPDTALAESLVALHGVLTVDRAAFLERIAEHRTECIVLTRSADPVLYAHVLSTIGAADSVVEEPAPVDHPPLPKPEPRLPPPPWMTEQPSGYVPPPVLALVPPWCVLPRYSSA